MNPTAHPLALRLTDWIASRHGVEHGTVTLDRKRVYILPTRAGLAFAVFMVALLVGSINYQLQLGFLLTFLVAAMAVNGMYYTHRNLMRLALRPHHVDDVFAGELASFQVHVANPSALARFAVHLSALAPAGAPAAGPRDDHPAPALPGIFIDLPPAAGTVAAVAVVARVRGRLVCPRLRLETRFPLGLWRAWAYYLPPLVALVYPAPEVDAPPLPLAAGFEGEGVAALAGGDDFAGVRPYQPGDSPRHIAWRLAARSDALALKTFETTAGAELLLDYATLDRSLDFEQRLARLARWVLMAEAAQLRYGLRLPGAEIEVGSGPAQRTQCLRALALARG